MMQNIAPSRALVRRSYTVLQLAFVLVSAGVFFITLGIGLFVLPIANESSDLYNFLRNAIFFGGIALCLIGVAIGIRAGTWKTENDKAKFVGQRLQQHLDDQFTYIRNINKMRLGYIDAVLVGTPGLLVFRVLDLKGEFLNEGDKWLTKNRRGEWVPADKNPTQDALDDMISLRAYLRNKGITEDIPIFGVVVFIDDHPIANLTVKDPKLPATHVTALYARLQSSYLAKDRLSKKTAKAIVDVLYSK